MNTILGKEVEKACIGSPNKNRNNSLQKSQHIGLQLITDYCQPNHMLVLQNKIDSQYSHQIGLQPIVTSVYIIILQA